MPAHVAHHVIDVLQAGGARHAVLRFAAKAGQERSVVVAALDEGVNGVAVGGDRRGGHAAEFVRHFSRLSDAARAAGRRLKPGGAGVVHLESDRAYAVAVPRDVLGDGVARAQRGGEYEADLALLHNVGSAFATAGFRTGIGDEAHAKSGSVVVSRLARIADVKLDVIGAL